MIQTKQILDTRIQQGVIELGYENEQKKKRAMGVDTVLSALLNRYMFDASREEHASLNNDYKPVF